MAPSRRRNRVLFLLGVLGLFGLLNFVPTGSWVPAGVGPELLHRFGLGFPVKWRYDPGYRHTGKKRDQHAVTPPESWLFDARAAAIDAGAAVTAALTALTVRTLRQRAGGGFSGWFINHTLLRWAGRPSARAGHGCNDHLGPRRR